eukprot:5180243-Pleurochrysis_carterae.AAC.1
MFADPAPRPRRTFAGASLEHLFFVAKERLPPLLLYTRARRAHTHAHARTRTLSHTGASAVDP